MTHRMTILLAALTLGPIANASTPRVVHRDDYVDRLRAMWVAENIANHTGLVTELQYCDPPFLTDAHWDAGVGLNGETLDYVFYDPWPADDDTDIEYVYVELMSQHGPRLTRQQIADGWIAHINRFIWVSNERARMLMDRGVLPPVTGSTAASRFAPFIDAQLTTEMFGAVAPGMPHEALEIADMPIRTTAASYAVHASQFHVALYAVAATADATLPLEDRILACYDVARELIPDASKTADIADYVLTDYLDNPDPDDWERTRDSVHLRYRLLAPDAYHGFPDPDALDFRYRRCTESSLNFAAGMIALLYGQGDLRRTIAIGAMTGWDSDNGTATVAGFLGLLLGYDAVAASFPEAAPLSDRYDIFRTRDNLTDHLPDDDDAQDTFTLIAERMADIAEEAIMDAGGAVRTDGAWLLPPDIARPAPFAVIDARSANLEVRRLGGNVTASSSVTANPDIIYGRDDPKYFATGVSHDASGAEPNHGVVERRVYGCHNAGLTTGDPVTLTVEYSLPVLAHTVRFIEDDHFPIPDAPAEGGWFTSLSLELKVGGMWLSPVAAGAGGVAFSEPLDDATPYQQIDMALDSPVMVTGVRLTGGVGGADAFVTAAEIDVLLPPPPDSPNPFDVSGDGAVSVEDIYAFESQPTDIDGDGDADADDRAWLVCRVRWNEADTIISP
ncbi:MAG: ADP-ribosylglycohydrolase family protein [Phycisphaerales bacterium]